MLMESHWTEREIEIVSIDAHAKQFYYPRTGECTRKKASRPKKMHCFLAFCFVFSPRANLFLGKTKGFSVSGCTFSEKQLLHWIFRANADYRNPSELGTSPLRRYSSCVMCLLAQPQLSIDVWNSRGGAGRTRMYEYIFSFFFASSSSSSSTPSALTCAQAEAAHTHFSSPLLVSGARAFRDLCYLSGSPSLEEEHRQLRVTC